MSRLRWKNKKDVEIKELIKQSGVVLSTKSGNKILSNKHQKAKKASSSSKREPNLGLNTKKGVFHVSIRQKKRQ